MRNISKPSGGGVGNKIFGEFFIDYIEIGKEAILIGKNKKMILRLKNGTF